MIGKVKTAGLIIALGIILSGCSEDSNPMETYNQAVTEAQAIKCMASLKELGRAATMIISRNTDPIPWESLGNQSGSALWESLNEQATGAMAFRADLLKCPGSGIKYRGPVDINTFRQSAATGAVIGMCAGCGNILRGNTVQQSAKGSAEYQAAMEATAE